MSIQGFLALQNYQQLGMNLLYNFLTYKTAIGCAHLLLFFSSWKGVCLADGRKRHVPQCAALGASPVQSEPPISVVKLT